MGCYEISLGDTIGIGDAGSTHRLLSYIVPKIGEEKLAVHFHNTYGQALSNILVSLQHNISVIDSSVSGNYFSNSHIHSLSFFIISLSIYI